MQTLIIEQKKICSVCKEEHDGLLDTCLKCAVKISKPLFRKGPFREGNGWDAPEKSYTRIGHNRTRLITIEEKRGFTGISKRGLGQTCHLCREKITDMQFVSKARRCSNRSAGKDFRKKVDSSRSWYHVKCADKVNLQYEKI